MSKKKNETFYVRMLLSREEGDNRINKVWEELNPSGIGPKPGRQSRDIMWFCGVYDIDIFAWESSMNWWIIKNGPFTKDWLGSDYPYIPDEQYHFVMNRLENMSMEEKGKLIYGPEFGIHWYHKIRDALQIPVWQEVEGQRVGLGDYGDAVFFAHHRIYPNGNKGKSWYISEARTGYSIIGNFDGTLVMATFRAVEYLEEEGKGRVKALKEKIEAITEDQVSPYFRKGVCK